MYPRLPLPGFSSVSCFLITILLIVIGSFQNQVSADVLSRLETVQEESRELTPVSCAL